MSHEPDLNCLAALVEGRLAAGERERFLSHVAQCRECRDVLSLLAERATISPAGAWWQRPAVWLPVAATLAVATVGVLLVRAPGSTPQTPAAPSSTSPAPSPPPADPSAGLGAGTVPAPPAVARPEAPMPPAPAQSDELLRRRGGARQVGAKTFQNVAGEWLDSSFDPGALLPVIEVTSDSARRDLLSRVPALEPYAALGDRVTVVHEGTVYRFAPTQP